MGRGHVELVHAPEIAPELVPAAGWPHGAAIRVLSRDAETGALTGILELPAGYRRGPGHHPVQCEFFVLEGSVRIGSVVREYGWYEFAPPGAAHEPWTVSEGCELLFMCRGTPDWIPAPGDPAAEAGRIRLDTELLPWQLTHVPGPPPGMILKLMRNVPETGEMTWICANPGRWEYPKLEFHDCIEELYCVQGDIWLANSGTMTKGSYLWRPPYITHGPFYSRTGTILIGWVDSTLVNHFPSDPRATVEENLAQAKRERQEQA